MKHSIKYVLLGLLSFFMMSTAYAQVTTSSLGGRILDEKGEPVIGAAVIATHEPSGTSYGAVTNLDGRYTIQGMRTGGPYKVEMSNLGYRTVTYTDVVLELGELFSLSATMKEATEALSEAVVIASPTSKFAAEKTGASTNISSSQMQNIPTVSRSISSIAKLSPYSGGGSMSFAGGDGRSTNFTVDGANFNNNFGLNAGLPGGGSPISIDAIEEMQVVISPFDVRQTNFIGGGVNAITKSGTNKFKGSAYVYHRNENMRGNRVDNEELVAREKDRNTTYGFTLGGPIVKNKLFFFVNYEHSVIPTVVNRWRPSKDGVADKDNYISRTTEEDMQKVADHLKEKYGYDAGSYTNYPADESNTKVLARIDWNINRDNHLALRYNYTLNRGWNSTNRSSGDFGQGGYRMPNGMDRLSEYSMAFSNSMYSKDNKVHSVSFDLNSRISDNLSNQFLATFSKLDDIRGTNSKPFPFIDIMNGYTGSLEEGNKIQTLEPYMSAGYELFTWNNGVHNNVVTVKDDLTYYLQNHKITTGLSYEYQMADNSYMREGTGYYRYSSIEDFLNDAAPETVALTHGYAGEKNPAARVQFSQIGLYVQDDWNVSDRFKLNAGIRFDTILYDNADLMRNQAIYDLDYNGRHIDTGKWPTTNVQVSPRVGFTWDVFGNKSLKVRGGTGLFAGRLPLVYFTNMPTNSGMVQNAKNALGTVYNTDGSIKHRHEGLDAFAGGMITDVDEMLKKLNQVDPEHFPLEISPDKGTLPGVIAAIDSHFKMPQVWKTSIAVDYQFPTSFPFSITGEFIYNKNVNNTLIKDWSMMDNNGFAHFNGPDNRRIYPSDYRYKYTNKDGKVVNMPSAYVLTNTSKGYGWTGNVTVNMEPVKGLSLMASYTHTVSKEVTGMPGNDAQSVFQGIPTVEGPNYATLQNSQYVTPDRIIASVSYHDKGNNHYSLFYEGMSSGRGESYIYNGDMNGDGIGSDLIYIPKTADEILFKTPADQKNFWDFVEQDKYLSSHKGQYAEAYSVYTPMVHRIDFRYSHDFKFNICKSTNVLQLNVDLMNVGNLFNSSWGVGKFFSSDVAQGRILKLSSINEEGQPVFQSMVGPGAKTWDYSHSMGQCWYLQVGIKYLFN